MQGDRTNTVIVHEKIADELESAILAKAEDLRATADGAPLRGLFSLTSADRIKSLLQDAKDKGAQVRLTTRLLRYFAHSCSK